MRARTGDSRNRIRSDWPVGSISMRMWEITRSVSSIQRANLGWTKVITCGLAAHFVASYAEVPQATFIIILTLKSLFQAVAVPVVQAVVVQAVVVQAVVVPVAAVPAVVVPAVVVPAVV